MFFKDMRHAFYNIHIIIYILNKNIYIKFESDFVPVISSQKEISVITLLIF